MSSGSWRSVAPVAYGGYLMVLLYLVLWPQPEAAESGVRTVTEVVRGLGFSSVTGLQVEIWLNVLLFVPLGLLGSLLWRRVPWWWWVGAGLVLSGVLELTQLWFLPDGVAMVSDLLANTLGAFMGAVAAASQPRHPRTYGGRAGVTARQAVLVGIGGTVIGALVFVVLAPTSEWGSSAVLAVRKGIRLLGGPEWARSPGMWELLLNIALFVPLGILGGLFRPRWSVQRWAAVGVVVSVVVETVQWVVLPNRDAAGHDVVMNAVGMVMGAAAATRHREFTSHPT